MAFCEGGRFEGQRGRAAAFDKDGKKIKEFKGNKGGSMHQENFIDAVRSRDSSLLKADVQVGHDSTGWCNLANIALAETIPLLIARSPALMPNARPRICVKNRTGILYPVRNLLFTVD